MHELALVPAIVVVIRVHADDVQHPSSTSYAGTSRVLAFERKMIPAVTSTCGDFFRMVTRGFGLVGRPGRARILMSRHLFPTIRRRETVD
jgi:hypothetical protein